MKTEQLAYFKSVLERQLRDLLKQGSETLSLINNPTERLPDLTDQASAETSYNFLVRIRDRESRLINKIRRALENIEDGTFGVCETCGEDINPARIQARPVTTLCIHCKTRQEYFERAVGQ